MTRRILMTLMLALGLVGCGATDTEDNPAPSETEQPDIKQVGAISLSLSSHDSKGREYRLRSANFTVTEAVYYYVYDGGSPKTITLSSEQDPNASILSTRLTPGEYLVSLQPGWYVERLSATGSERVAKTVLLSASEQYTYVSAGSSTSLQFRIGVDGDLIDFRYGELNIDTVIELPGESNGNAPCDFGPITMPFAGAAEAKAALIAPKPDYYPGTPIYPGAYYPNCYYYGGYDGGIGISYDAGSVSAAVDAGVSPPTVFAR
jgi:hypothetical protein